MRGLPGDSESGENPIIANDSFKPTPLRGATYTGILAEEMLMNSTQAGQIAVLLNKQNKLDGEYDADLVLSSADQYLFETDEATGDIRAAVEVKRVQWYQHEVLHLSVSPDHRREGLGKGLLIRAEDLAKQNHARILQCTIRADNSASCALFKSVGFRHTATFTMCGPGTTLPCGRRNLSQQNTSRAKPWRLATLARRSLKVDVRRTETIIGGERR